jgi:hypothetical protein
MVENLTDFSVDLAKAWALRSSRLALFSSSSNSENRLDRCPASSFELRDDQHVYLLATCEVDLQRFKLALVHIRMYPMEIAR